MSHIIPVYYPQKVELSVFITLYDFLELFDSPITANSCEEVKRVSHADRQVIERDWNRDDAAVTVEEA